MLSLAVTKSSAPRAQVRDSVAFLTVGEVGVGRLEAPARMEPSRATGSLQKLLNT